MRTRNGFTNDTDFVSDDFLANNLAVGIPYLFMISLASVSGTIGNAMVIGAVLTYKVKSVT